MQEFQVHREFRRRFFSDSEMFSPDGKIFFDDLAVARQAFEIIVQKADISPSFRAEDLYALGIINKSFHIIVQQYFTPDSRGDKNSVYEQVRDDLSTLEETLQVFVQHFPPAEVYRRELSPAEYVDAQDGEQVLRALFILYLNNMNPGFSLVTDMITDKELRALRSYTDLIESIRRCLLRKGGEKEGTGNFYSMLIEPARRFPTSLQDQLEYIAEFWGDVLGDLMPQVLRAIDYLKEVNSFETRAEAVFSREEMSPYDYGDAHAHGDDHGSSEEGFSNDMDWMQGVVLLAKSTLVWLDQLSRKYGYEIRQLDQIPDQELDSIASRGFTGLWLIGLWERSEASRTIKQRCGNPEAAASAYALYSSEISQSIGGWEALEHLRSRCLERGIRLAADMVPNHTGIDSRWVHDHPDWFLSLPYMPYPTYSFNSDNLSSNPDIGIYLEDHYYQQSDAAVVFKRVDFRKGETRYLYHGNDGSSIPWNDTAQLDYLNPALREAVIQTILHVARNFPIIRFDAAMTLAKKHIHRLWFPAPGSGGDIPSRSEHGLSDAEFNRLMPKEFWRDVVNRIGAEVPGTLLLAEAFWMMEGYFVRNLGMHRVYNSAFMNMLKNEENANYRETIKNTLTFDPEILKRFVNFMNNPDEETAIAQFGDGDKYFGICTLMVTMPGLPMFGHGQIEGFTEKYGMEYQRAYLDEHPRADLIERHEREVFPLMKKRELFSEVKNFRLYDFLVDGVVNENVFAYSNATDRERVLVVYNNVYQSVSGRIAEGGLAFELSSDPDVYCLLRESRSGLWYIRSSVELREQGLWVSLRGYEAQVYLDIHEVRDDASGRYRQLHDDLSGVGIYSQDLFPQDFAPETP